VSEKGSPEYSRKAEIQEERDRERALPAAGVIERILCGGIERAVGNMLFHTAPELFAKKLDFILDRIREDYRRAEPSERRSYLTFLAVLTVDMQSLLPLWELEPLVTEGRLDAEREEVFGLLTALEKLEGETAAAVADALLADAAARRKAEGSTAGGTAGGEALSAVVGQLAVEVADGSIRRAAVARFRGDSSTELGNDYAVFLKHMMRLGGSFVTTNPVLVKMAWDLEEERWDRRADEIIADAWPKGRPASLLAGPRTELDAAIGRVCSLMTMSVVEENCRLLRDIYLATQGREGYVSLQVNPTNHGDDRDMIREARQLYGGLRERLGGVPNVVFKLPATGAGLVAAEQLTSEGIGVTVTVSFSVFQAMEFARVLARGGAPVCYIALMNGRMAFPVRDELAELGVEGGAEAARWAGVEVARKTHRLLYDLPEKGGLGIDPNRVKLLIASLRIYDDWIPDVSELWGCQVITFFPNVRRKYDDRERGFRADAVYSETPAEVLQVLLESEIFRQAWWMPGDAEETRPRRPLSLAPEDAEALLEWPPVAQTLGQFVDQHREMGRKVESRMRAAASRDDAGDAGP